MAQATMLQAMARASIRLGIRDETWPALKSGLAIFQQPPPTGVRVDTPNGAQYLLYSMRPRLFVLNGFAQALVGLYDFGAYANDDTARALYATGDAELQTVLPSYDTGAWSLYSRDEVTRESDLSYHRLVTGFLQGLCDRTQSASYCTYRQRFDNYLTLPPAVEITSTRLRGGRPGRIKFRLSKISRVGIRVLKGDRVTFAGTQVAGYGRRAFAWTPPRRKGRYMIELTATDLAGNATSTSRPLEVLKGRRRKK
jgi:hypothetical protein